MFPASLILGPQTGHNIGVDGDCLAAFAIVYGWFQPSVDRGSVEKKSGSENVKKARLYSGRVSAPGGFAANLL